MNLAEIIQMFRVENPEITKRVIDDPLLHNWALLGDKEVCAQTRCIVTLEPTTIGTTADDTWIDLVGEIEKFYDIDEIPGGGVAYNDKRLIKTTVAELDNDTNSSWRTRNPGTPEKYYRRESRIYFDRPINSGAKDVDIYAILISDDFVGDGAIPYNSLSYLEPFHGGILKFLQWKAKEKIGKGNEGDKAASQFVAYAKWMKKELAGGRHAPILYMGKK